MKPQTVRLIAKVFFWVFVFVLPCYPQELQKEEITGDADVLKEISKDLAELNKLVRMLAAPSQPDRRQLSYDWTGGDLGVPLSHSYNARSEPHSDAQQTVTFNAGETAYVVYYQGDWALARTEDGRAGWVEVGALGFADQASAVLAFSFGAVLEKVREIRQKYEDKPVRVSGFSVNLTLPPGVSITFEFQ